MDYPPSYEGRVTKRDNNNGKKENQEMNKQILEYNYVRAIAVLLVILGHCSYYKIMTDYGGVCVEMPHENIASRLIGFQTGVLYHFHMPLFVALSGCLYCVALRRKGSQPFTAFVRKKAHRLLLPFVGTALLWSIPLKYISGYWEGSAWEVIQQIFVGQFLMFGNFNSHLWFLQAIFLIFIMAWLIERLTLRKKTLLFFCALLVVSIIGKILGAHHYCLLNVQQAMAMLVWFYVGFYFEKYRPTINEFINQHVRWFAIVAAVVLYSMLVLAKQHLPQFMGMGYITYYPLALMGMIVVYALSYKLLKIIPPPSVKFY